MGRAPRTWWCRWLEGLQLFSSGPQLLTSFKESRKEESGGLASTLILPEATLQEGRADTACGNVASPRSVFTFVRLWFSNPLWSLVVCSGHVPWQPHIYQAAL